MNIADINYRLIPRNITCMSIILGSNNDNTRLNVTCLSCSHIWNVSLQGIVYQKRGCPRCSLQNRVKQRTKSQNDFDKELCLVAPSIKRIEPYTGNHHKILFECKHCLFKWNKLPTDIIHSKHGCPRCSKRERITNELIDEKLIYQNRTIIRVEDSCGCMQKINWKCKLCSGVWRARPNDVFSTHKSDCPYCKRKNYSKIAIKWLTNIEQNENKEIIHAGRGNEYRIPGTKLFVDGFCKDTNTVYEFHGNAFHGNPRLFNSQDKCHPFDNSLTAGELYSKTIEREQRIKNKGYKLIVMWEDEFRI